MRIACLVFCAAMTCLPGISIAGETLPEPQAMIYYQIPLGAGGRSSRHTFGLRVDQTIVRGSRAPEFQSLMARPALLEFRAGYQGVETFSVAGMDYAQRYRALRQNEEGGAAPEAGNSTAGADAGTSGDEAAGDETTNEETGLTIGKLLDETEPGWLIGGVLGIVLLTGALN